jgi:NAD(P)-dependent dehydrogenase (short-subunit alcohol dehydrogenase family)
MTMGTLDGRVAFITGAARGMGRAHAVKLASEGADIIAVDIAGKLPPCVRYDPATPEDLAETVRLVGATGRRILASVVDTRDIEGLRQAVDDGVAAYGRLDIIVANAGISAPGTWDAITPEDFRDVIDVNVTGVWNTVMAGAQKIIDGGRGGSIILIGSLGRAIETYPRLVQMITPFLPTWAAEPEDIADAVCWLASEEAKNVTAAAISIDQGMTQY